ncbi:DNA primase [Blattabacterium sp. (Blaberus giganteus)]|uniref:DNA primase n=1 Tax=Blattabacterium sp. (Blaberus giganteus) TaxID=1186051 RepID=UPI00025F6F25|nr:DNA primase [Blattabacterium sp. (Blaberus giganteus)]AFJ90733.1 DNA primase [Blattabacterium sp. (Blaberus giganteus)]
MIYKETIKKILSVSCIEDVIGNFVELKKSGLNYRGLSPFSHEKTPSLIVSPTKKIWKDFSSGKGGNIITFLMEHEHFTYEESLRFLAKKYNIKIDNNDHKRSKYKEEEYDQLYLIQDYAKRFFMNQLHSTKEGQENGLNYLIQKRGFDIKIIKKFELGYAPISWNILTKTALKQGFTIRNIKKSGLTVLNKYNHFFDCFRQRVMFPIHNLSGKVIGFGGRNIDYRYSTKYINSSESNIFQKSKILYGLFQAKKNILKENFCYLVEGYTDVISLYQSRIKNVVSSSGISLTVDQILLIKKFTKNIVLFYDGDRSGIKASLRGINMMLEQEMNLRILFIYNGEDPDFISKKYSFSQLRDFLAKNSYNFVSFKQKIYEKFHKHDPIKKSFLVKNILNSISKISNVIQKELYLQEASKILNIRQKILISELKRISEKNVHKLSFVKENITFFSKKTNTILVLEDELIQLILNHGNQIIKKEKYNTTVLEEVLHVFKCWNLRFSLNKNQEIFDQICLQKKKTNLSKFFYKKNTKFYSLSKWDKKGIQVSSKEDHMNQYMIDILLRYKSLYISKLIQKEIIHYQNYLAKDEDRKVFIKKIMHLTNIKNKLHKKLHRYV